MSDEPKEIEEDNLRWFAERIIAGEFKSLAIVMTDEKNVTHTFCECNLPTAIGLVEWASFWWKNKMLNSD